MAEIKYIFFYINMKLLKFNYIIIYYYFIINNRATTCYLQWLSAGVEIIFKIKKLLQ